MGQGSSFPVDPPETVVSRINKSKALTSRLTKKKEVLSSMIKRTLSAEQVPEPDIWMLPDAALQLLVKFLAADMPSLSLVSTRWHLKLNEAIDAAFSPIESQFALAHSHLLGFRNSYASVSHIEVSNRRGLRVDRVIAAEVLPILRNRTIKLRYTYRSYASANIYKAEFKFDCVPKKTRAVWAHRDECKFHGEENRKAYTQQIPTVCVGDYLEFAFNWLNLLGLVRLESVQWQPPLIEDTKQILKNLQLAPEFSRERQDEGDGIKKKLYLYNVSRHCEVELSQTEWYDARYYNKPSQVYIFNHFYPFLKLIKSEFAGVDVTVSKNTFVAERCGVVPDAYERIGLRLEVVDGPVTHEVKRMGLLYDQARPLELRLGDSFILYISRGG